MSSSEQTFLNSVQDQNMQGQGRTQREDYFEDLQKMERRLKDEDPGPKPGLTYLEKVATELQTTKYNIAFAKLTLLEIEHRLAKERSNMKDVDIKEREDEIARMREFHADVQHSFDVKEAEREAILKSKSAYAMIIPTLT